MVYGIGGSNGAISGSSRTPYDLPFPKWGSRHDMTWQKISTRFLLHMTLWAGKQQFTCLIQTLTRINTHFRNLIYTVLHRTNVWQLPSRTFLHRHQSLQQAQLLVLLLLMFFLLLAVNVTLDTTNVDPCSAEQLHSVYMAYRLNDTIHNTLMRDSASCHDFDFHDGSGLLRHTSGGCNTASWVHCSQTYTKY